MKKKYLNKISIILLSLILFSSIKVFGYGFGFKRNSNHEQPDIGSYAKELVDTNSYFVGDKENKDIYLTFDAGYDNGNLSTILDILKEKKVYATFFVTGDFINRQKDLVLRIVNEGHIIGNHTYNHKDITKISDEEIKYEVKKLEDAYKSVTGLEMIKYFRPPEGSFNKHSLNVIKDLGYTTFFWSIAYNDWNTNNQKGGDYGYEKIMSNLHNGAIILLHTVSKDNKDCLEAVIDETRKQGYEFKQLNHLINNI